MTIQQKQQNDYGFPQWLKYLMDVLRPNWKDNGLGNELAKAIALLDSFYDQDNEVMIGLVKAYLSDKSDAYIPFPGDLRKHLQEEPYEQTRPSRAFHIWHKLEVAAKWPVCPACGEHTPSITNCPLCADMRDEAKRTAAQIANKDWLQGQL